MSRSESGILVGVESCENFQLTLRKWNRKGKEILQIPKTIEGTISLRMRNRKISKILQILEKTIERTMKKKFQNRLNGGINCQNITSGIWNRKGKKISRQNIANIEKRSKGSDQNVSLRKGEKILRIRKAIKKISP